LAILTSYLKRFGLAAATAGVGVALLLLDLKVPGTIIVIIGMALFPGVAYTAGRIEHSSKRKT